VDNELTNEQLSGFRETLAARSRELRREVLDGLSKSEDEQYIDVAGRVRDAGDSSVADLLVDINLAEVGRDIEEIRDIEAALRRMTEGEYGLCSDCGNAINIERLKANPVAQRCIHCQEVFERTHAQPMVLTRPGSL
jgi:DnaK suppressor protein